jgi:hypothetical protein
MFETRQRNLKDSLFVARLLAGKMNLLRSVGYHMDHIGAWCKATGLPLLNALAASKKQKMGGGI